MTVEELIERLQEGLRLRWWMAHHEVVLEDQDWYREAVRTIEPCSDGSGIQVLIR